MKALLVVAISVFFCGKSFASATASEFIPCKKIAVSELEHCLRDDGDNCWEKSKLSFDSCHKRVIKRHSVDPARLKAAKEAREKALKEQND